MHYPPLLTVKNRLTFGAAVPFNIYNADHTLLLARGQMLRDESQLEALLDRNAVVDSNEIKSPRDEVNEAPPESLPALWSLSIDRVGRTLRNASQTAFAEALTDAAEPVLALVERDPDLAIFQVVRPESVSKTSYAVSHSVHAAITSYLVARRLGWQPAHIEKVFKAALTMNMAMLELQNRLTSQLTPLTALQRESIKDHSLRGMELLQASGVTDMDWLLTIKYHHDLPAPELSPDANDTVRAMAALLRRADVYTAKLSARATRKALPANQAGRDLFMQDQKNPMAAAVIKEFGIYPPGCYVTLQSGEVGVVIKRGANANTPIVAALTNRNGDAMLEPVKRNTEQREHAVVGVTNEDRVRVRAPQEKLVVLAHR